MNSTLQTRKTLILELNEEEAKWLAGNLQNPLHSFRPEEESAEDREMRLRFFHAVQVVTVSECPR